MQSSVISGAVIYASSELCAQHTVCCAQLDFQARISVKGSVAHICYMLSHTCWPRCVTATSWGLHRLCFVVLVML